MTLSEEQKTYITEKIEKVFHYSGRADDESSRADVDIEHENTKDKQNHIYCKVNIFIPNGDLHAESYGQSVEATVDECEGKLTRQMRKYKTRMQF